MTRDERIQLAKRRILKVLKTYQVCSSRTLENKIADAGPYDMRVDPHLITEALRQLREADGRVILMARPTGYWYTLPSVPQAGVNARLAELEPLQETLSHGGFALRVGQALEVAVYRALVAVDELDVLGAFLDFDEHGDDTRYRKEEPPTIWRRNRCPTGRLDFIVVARQSGIAGGVEVKNGREWIYPDRNDVRELLAKCCALDVVPILIARRLHFTTTRLLIPRGGIVWETYFQRIPAADATWAERARDKHLLGYHDLRLGNEPDTRMTAFAAQLSSLLPKARAKFESGRAELEAFSRGSVSLRDLGLNF